ncbi:MAG: hypothetical protein GY760_14150 [Deltaproteobacteria bacterium]|nr:hypothetical protein [Deltaproteobacteria bacterium]
MSPEELKDQADRELIFFGIDFGSEKDYSVISEISSDSIEAFVSVPRIKTELRV